MNIDHIRNYNQKMLALISTLVVILLLIAVVSATYISYTEYSRYQMYEEEESGILSEEKIQELQKEEKREQLISYQLPRLVDTINQIYIVPISHKSLEYAESYQEDGVLGLVSMEYKPSQSDRRYSRRHYGKFNNIVLYDYKSGKTEKLFDERLNFENIHIEYFEDDILLVVQAAHMDTYKDQVINLEDLKSLYIYSLSQRKLKLIREKNIDVADYRFVSSSKDFHVTLGTDRNGDGYFDDYREPATFMKYDYENEALIQVISKDLELELQAKLDGRIIE